MNKIKFNNYEFEIESYSKNTYFSNDTISSNANCSIITNDIDSLMTLAQNTITSLQIYHDDSLIYNLQNIEAHIDNISETLNDDKINIYINLIFKVGE